MTAVPGRRRPGAPAPRRAFLVHHVASRLIRFSTWAFAHCPPRAVGTPSWGSSPQSAGCGGSADPFQHAFRLLVDAIVHAPDRGLGAIVDTDLAQQALEVN